MNPPLVFFSSQGGVTTHQLLLEIILLDFILLSYIMSLSFYFVPFFAGLLLFSRFYDCKFYCNVSATITESRVINSYFLNKEGTFICI